MANTVTAADGIINVTFDGATNWDSTSGSGLVVDPTEGLRIYSLTMLAGAVAGDILTVREGGASGPILVRWTAGANEALTKLFNPNHRHKLFVTGTEASSGVILVVEL